MQLRSYLGSPTRRTPQEVRFSHAWVCPFSSLSLGAFVRARVCVSAFVSSVCDLHLNALEVLLDERRRVPLAIQKALFLGRPASPRFAPRLVGHPRAAPEAKPPPKFAHAHEDEREHESEHEHASKSKPLKRYLGGGYFLCVPHLKAGGEIQGS